MNVGKIFESDFKKSVPSYALLYRIPDPAQSFNKTSGLRFSARPPFDYLLWDSKKKRLYALELKTVQGNSISFEKSKDEHGDIHYYQIQELKRWGEYNGIVSGFVIQFRRVEKTIFIPIDEFEKLIGNVLKKSFNVCDIDKYSVKYFVIEQTKLKTHYRYNINGFLEAK